MNLLRAMFINLLAAALLSANLCAAADQNTQGLYKSKCQGCHGADGKATTIGKKLGAKDFQDPDVAKLSEADLVQVTEQGKNKMPSYKGKLTDDQIRALAKYIKEMK